MPEQRSRPRDSRVIALANQKGGTGKTTTTVNLGIGLARLGKKVLLIDADPQGDLTTCLGWQDQDSLQTTLATVMGKIIRDEPFTADEGILHHSEGVDLMPANIELSGVEVTMVNAMSREKILKQTLEPLKEKYDHITYIQNSDYLIPNIVIRKTKPLGHYGRLRKAYLEMHRPILFNELVLSDKLFEHCAEIDEAARNRMELIVRSLAKQYGVTEQLKAENQMEWVRQMNACKAQADEIVKAELIYD